MMKNAIVLCSGGLDSVVTAHYIKKGLKYERLKILFFNYGQRALKQERNSSKRCAKNIGAEFIELDLSELGKISHSLINKKGKIRKLSNKDLKNTSKENEKFYVPCRNLIFLSYAFSLAESLYIDNKERYDLFVGFKCEGKESYPDTTKEFVESMNKISKVSTKGFKIYAPFIEKDKEEIIALGTKLGINFKETLSCYSPIGNKHCGFCLACVLRKAGFYWANIKDNTDYNE